MLGIALKVNTNIFLFGKDSNATELLQLIGQENLYPRFTIYVA